MYTNPLKNVVLSCLLGLLITSSCRTEPVLSKQAIALSLLSKNTSASQFRLLIRLHPEAAFYAGLLAEAADTERAVALFELALNSTIPLVRNAAAQKLIRPALERVDLAKRLLLLNRHKDLEQAELTLRCASFYTVGGFSDAVQLATYTHKHSWNTVITLLALQSQTAEPAADFFLNEPVDEAFLWGWEAAEHSFSPVEIRAVKGRIATARRSYQEALNIFKVVIEQEPDFFLRHPQVLFDLGRSFQYVNPTQGLKLFLEWDALFEDADAQMAESRYYLQYFAGRMERYRGNYTQAMDYFAQALSLTDDPAQEDLCIWYLLDSARINNPEQAVQQFVQYAPLWHDPDYYSDIVGTLCRQLAAQEQWHSLLNLFAGMRRYADGSMVAQYAYIVARLIETGLIPAAEAARLLDFAEPSQVSRLLFTQAFEEKAASYYYRAASAQYLGKAVVLPETQEPVAEAGTDLTFFSDFFEYGAGDFAFSSIQAMAAELSSADLRRIASICADFGYTAQSIRTVLLYQNRPDYESNRTDLLLLYPRPFLEIIEDNARKMGIPAEVLFGLIRTESIFDPNAHSSVGALGLSQLMPETAEEEARRIFRNGGPNYGTKQSIEVFNPSVNVHIGASYLHYLIPQVENTLFALMAYNGGIGRVKRWRNASPHLPADLFAETVEFTETREYGKRVISSAAVYGYLYYAKSMEYVVKEIYSPSY
ncbi:MAG: lytic transglycosylase domain-containing protein [Spirochaetaceae bacterium]|jgi:soluble lytic murein transglycosylase|nr:lytic transglycosylase domain-containing protein [Spirochaetaceae bacterium]